MCDFVEIKTDYFALSDQLSAGQHSVIWNGKDNNGKSVSSGIYFYKLKKGKYQKVKKMILMK